MEIEEALERIVSAASEIDETITVPLEEAYGRILADTITADVNVPAFARSAMDGYAVRAEDITDASKELPVRLRVITEVLAGGASQGKYEKMTAVRVMTGAMIPQGYDAVVRQEDTDLGESEVCIFASVRPYMNYCKVGEEIRKGETVIPAGRMMGRTEIGLLASLGMDRVPVKRPLKTAIISTGSELTEPGKALVPGCIYGSIRYILAASIRSAGFEVSYAVDCPDDLTMIENEIRKALERADLIITTGGVSVGKKDLVADALSELGASTLFTRINIQPGTPTIGSVLGDKLILSLSGNPYAAIANYDLYFPALAAKMMCCEALHTVTAEAVLCDPYEKVNTLRRLVRAYEESGKVYLPVEKHMSSVFGNMDRCNCYIDIPAVKKIAVGDTVQIRRIRFQ